MQALAQPPEEGTSHMGWAAISLTSPRDREAKRQSWWPLAEGLSGTSSRAGLGWDSRAHRAVGAVGAVSGEPGSSSGGGALFTERLTWQTHPLP